MPRDREGAGQDPEIMKQPWTPMGDENDDVGTGVDPEARQVEEAAGGADSLGGADDMEQPAQDLSAWGPGGVALGPRSAGGSEPAPGEKA